MAAAMTNDDSYVIAVVAIKNVGFLFGGHKKAISIGEFECM